MTDDSTRPGWTAPRLPRLPSLHELLSAEAEQTAVSAPPPLALPAPSGGALVRRLAAEVALPAPVVSYVLQSRPTRRDPWVDDFRWCADDPELAGAVLEVARRGDPTHEYRVQRITEEVLA